MYQVFNMGQRLEIYTDENTAYNLIEIAKKFHIEAKIIGNIQANNIKQLVINTKKETLVCQ